MGRSNGLNLSLYSIYAANRHAFWSSNIASQYSADQYISPSRLKQAFLEHKVSSNNPRPIVHILTTTAATPGTRMVSYAFSAIYDSFCRISQRLYRHTRSGRSTALLVRVKSIQWRDMRSLS